MNIERFSFGIGDRFGLEGAAQLRALQHAKEKGVDIVPVWNKSNREHTIIGTSPDDTRAEADAAVKECGWRDSYYVDADHIGLATVERFLAGSNFFTIDVADEIGKPASQERIAGFLKQMSGFKGTLRIPGIETPLQMTDQLLEASSRKYLGAVVEAGKVYRHIAERKGKDSIVAEVSVDESNAPQTPVELFCILAAMSQEGIPLQTIAPKFTGSFLKGIDYRGDVEKFRQEFYDDLAVLKFAIKSFNLPSNLKLSVHSGSDKFSLYSIISEAVQETGSGLHVKTAGTTWLEEVIGLASAGGEGLQLAKDLYAQALKRYDELCKPYLPVIDIDKSQLPDPEAVARWDEEQYVGTLRHDQQNPAYSVHFRQLIHVSFRLAAEMGSRYTSLLKKFRKEIELNVTTNLFDRHIAPLFLGTQANGGQPAARKAKASA